MVYFLLFRGIGCAKIGYSANPSKRIHHLARVMGETPEILGVIKGTRATESALLDHFHHLRLFPECEWLSPAPEFLRYVAEVQGKVQAPALRPLRRINARGVVKQIAEAAAAYARG